MSQKFASDLPKDRPFTRLEAAYSVALDHYAEKTGTLRGYADLWQWNHHRVKRFLTEIDMLDKVIKNHQITVPPTSQIRPTGVPLKPNKIKEVYDEISHKHPNNVPLTSRTINREEREKEHTDFFETLWKDYPARAGAKGSKAKALARFKATVKNEGDRQRIRQALDNYLATLRREKAGGFDRKPQNGETWFNNWQDWENLAPPPATTTGDRPSTGNGLEELRAKGIDV